MKKWLSDKWRYAPLLFLVLFLIILLRTAWMCDDAYITLRTVDNFINGYGLTWNVTERVQAYTHPLWMFLMSLFYLITKEAFITTIVVSMAVSLSAVLVFAFKIAPSTKTAILGLLIFILSKFFVDYSTSGLENPLTHLLLALFFLIYFSKHFSYRRFCVMAFIASLLMLTRLDLILLVAPALWFQMRRSAFRKSIRHLIIGFLPLTVWELFSFWYYGSLVPNTGYAKLNTGIRSWDLIVQGSHYLEAAFRGDRLMVLVILVAVGMTIWRKGRAGWPAALGIFLYVAYVTYSGGCFMGGRFFTGPLIVAVILLSQYERLMPSRRKTAIVFVIVLVVGLVTTRSPLYSGSQYGLHDDRGLGYGIDDNRLLLFQHSGLWTTGGWHNEPDHPWVEKGRKFRREIPDLLREGGIGFTGYYSGPEVYIVDIHALSDPLLARLPAAFEVGWRIGHFRRAMPEGYRETLESGDNQIIDPNLAQYYDSLKYVVSGPLWDWRRLTTAMRLNLGAYNQLLDNAEKQIISIYTSEMRPRVSDGTDWTHGDMHVFPFSGIRIYLDSVWHAEKIEIGLDGNDAYAVSFGMDQEVLAEVMVNPDSQESVGSRTYTIAVPDLPGDGGFDRLIIKPVSGDGIYAIGHVSQGFDPNPTELIP